MQVQFLISRGSATFLETVDVSTFEELKNTFARLFGQYPFVDSIVYYDDEGDKIKLTCEPEFNEAINFAVGNGNFLSVIVEEGEVQKEQPKPAPVPEKSPLEDFAAKIFGN